MERLFLLAIRLEESATGYWRIRMQDDHLVAFLQWALPHMDLLWPGYRKVRRQVSKRIARRIRALELTDLEAYRQYLLYEPNEPGAHYNLGACYAAVGQYADARQELGECARLRPSDVGTRLLLGKVLAKLGDIDGANEQQRVLRRLDRRASVELLEFVQRLASTSSSQSTGTSFSVGLNPEAPSAQKTGGTP